MIQKPHRWAVRGGVEGIVILHDAAGQYRPGSAVFFCQYVKSLTIC